MTTSFKDFLNGNLLIEMPHMKVGDKFIDLELEVHIKMSPNEFIGYINDWVSGKQINSKTKGLKMSINKEDSKLFAKKLLGLEFFKNFVIFHYGDKVWSKIESDLKAI